MADPEDRMQPEGGPPDGRPRRPPPIIEGEAVEISPDGSRASTAGAWPPGREWLSARIRSVLSQRKVAAIAAAAIIAVIVAGTSWIYFGADGGHAPPQGDGPERAAAGGAAVVGADTAGPASGDKAAGKTPDTKVPDTKTPDTRTPDTRTPDTRTSDARELEARLAAVDATFAALNERIAELDRAVRDATAAARAATERAGKAAQLMDEVMKNGDERAAAQQLDRGAIDDLASRIKALEARQMTLRQIQERLDHLAGMAGAPDRDVRAAVAAAALRNAVERDRPFVAELAAARALGLDEQALAAMERFAAGGLSRQDALFRDLSAILPELRRVSAPPGQDQNYLGRIQASAARMLNIRPVKDEPGDDPPAVLGRIEFKMARQDIDGIIAELDKLPAQAKEVAQPWRTAALARRDAVEAARLLAAAALAKLGNAATSGSSTP